MLEGLRYLTDDLLALRRMTKSEFDLRMEGAILRAADREEELAKLALYIRRAQAHRKDGTYIIKNHTDMVDVRKVEDLIFNRTNVSKDFERLLTIAKNLNEYYDQRKEVD